MATDMSGQGVNGSYAAQASYEALDTSLPNNSHINSSSVPNGSGAPAIASAAANSSQNSPSKDEVGWYFVEQYYTTLSRAPEKIHLFYAKRSQFVSGVEAEKVSVSVGQRAISERIKELDIQDCKVRVTNVDSQESGRDIVVQVIGEMSNKSAPHRKFVQTFILAEQPNGYYVLNDIFRYMADEEEEVEEQTPLPLEGPLPVTEETEPHTLSGTDEGPVQGRDTEILDKKLEETAAEPEAEPSAVAAPVNNDIPVTQLDSLTMEDTKSNDPEPNQNAVEEAEISVAEADIQPEVPKEPEPTAAPSPKPTEASPNPVVPSVEETPTPPKPAAPKTWASMVAGPKAPVPVVPQVPQVPAAAAAPNQMRPTPQGTPTPVSTAAAPTEEALPSPGGWQTAGQEHGRKQGRQQSSSASGGTGDRGNVSAYIKNVLEKVDAAALKNTLSKYGRLDYFDISRPKNCAFVEFADPAGYQAAVAANPHVVNGVEISVEERRRNAQGYGGFNARGGMRGRGGLDGRTSSQGGRGNFNKDGRGNFGPRGRGGNMVQRGRGTAQAV